MTRNLPAITGSNHPVSKKPSNPTSNKPKKIKARDLIKMVGEEAEQVNSLSELAETVIKLKCKVCGVEEHIPIEEFIEKATKKPYLCKICPEHPELFAYKWNPFKVMMAGLVSEQKKKGISDALMKEMIGIVAVSPITPVFDKVIEKRQLKKGSNKK